MRKLGLVEYEMPQREQYVIDAWTKSLSDYRADVVLLGDSITWGGDWSLYFSDVNLCCLAIPGDEIEQVLYRTDMVVDLESKKIFVMLGINGSRNVNYEEILHDAFSDESGKLNPQYSKDGVHINESGYDLWASLIEGYVYERTKKGCQ